MNSAFVSSEELWRSRSVLTISSISKYNQLRELQRALISNITCEYIFHI